jgi:hypothetical protein
MRRIKMLKYMCMVFFIALCSSGYAGEKCKDTRTPAEFFLEEFTKSFHAIDDYQTYLEAKGHQKIYCLPPKINKKELVALFVKYYTSSELLNEMPRAGGLDGDNLQPPFGDLIAYVLTTKYPCKN